MLYFYFSIFFNGLKYFFNKGYYAKEMLLSLSCILIFTADKVNVKIYASQLGYLEYISIAIVSYIISQSHKEKYVKT